MRNIYSLWCMLLLPAMHAIAQDRTVTGSVTAKDDGTALAGVNIKIRNANVGTQTNIDGTYTIKVTTDTTVLVFSYIGFETQELQVGSRSRLDIALAQDMRQLGEVVVTALGIRREEKSIGFGAQKIDGGELSNVRETNLVHSLSGKLAGVQVAGNTGSMGGSAKINIRGINSIYGNNNPLFVVDGMPMENRNTNSLEQQRGSGGYDFGNSIQDLNPNDVENVTVLKGAAATALYGSRGSNGVIVVTTKKGGKSRKPNLSYSFGYNIDKVYKLPRYQNKYGGGYRFTKLYYNDNPEAFPEDRKGSYDDNDGLGRYDLLPQYATDESWGPKFEGQLYRPYWSWDKERKNPDFGKVVPWEAQPDNIRSFFETGGTFNHNISLDGATEKGSYRVSYSNLDQKFILPNSKLVRHNASINASYEALKNLTISGAANFVTHSATGRPGTGYGDDGANVMVQFTQWGQRQVDFTKMKEYELPDGTQLTWNRTAWFNPTPRYSNNPYWVRHKNYESDGRTRFFGNLAANYKLAEGLTAEVKYMTDTYFETQEERVAIGSQYTSQYWLSKYGHLENNFQGLLSYNKPFNKDFSWNANLGINQMTRTGSNLISKTVDGLSSNVFSLEASMGRPDITDLKTKKRINSVFASSSLGYKDMLFLDLGARNDWSSTLPVKHNSYFYPSGSVSWIASGIIDANWLNFLKFRGALAQVGNDTDPYNTVLSYLLYQPFGGDSRVSVPNTLPNPDLKPEITSEYEFGTEIKVLNNRLGINLSYYNRRTRNQIIPLSRSAATGATFKYINAGLLENKGIELSLNASPVSTEHFKWDVTLNWAKNNNKIVRLTTDQKTMVLTNAPFAVQLEAREGESFGSIVGFDFVYNEKGQKVVNEDGVYLRSDDQKVLGSVLPSFTGGLINALRYKGFNFSALIDFQKGGSFFSTTQMFGRETGILEETAEGSIREDGMIAEGVKQDGTPNDVVITARTHYSSNGNGGYNINSIDVIDASYIYLREISLGYSLPAGWISRTPFSKVRLSLVGRNLWLMKSNSQHVDPTAITNSISNWQGLEGGALPSVRSMGVNVSFGF
ncbi:SusC/RagA family TonB-linked outer membrane protein [Dyadobacter sp. CY261]|uniref:SusC/RagA family TonB-linked outer membrane protein n=1 Tax=Dyadobacter sp. CY261 TaxID=2907203 RepID=UPI001F266156|nr:SusC/RagA family TonB-linked outer membrane protein [Dyadobacter sp. CY261]MCF0071162.1 SusC/RagA family TonB-linked outer membrane protein [Dyadobacter sp. CY261]